LKTVAAVEECPDARAALVAGEISIPQAEEIAHTEREVPGSAPQLLDVAKRSSLRAVRDRARARRAAAISPDVLYAKQGAARQCRHWRNEIGNVVIHAELPPDVGVKLVNRLDRATDRLVRAAGKEGRREGREAYAADAFAAMLDGGSAGNGTSNNVDVVITIDWHSFMAGELVEGGHSHIVGGGPIPPSVVREMAEDAFLKAVLHDGVGRRVRAVIRTALQLGAPPRFEGAVCSEEACERQYHLEIHHVDPVANRGPTQIDNLKLECPPHHWELTERDRRAGKLRPRGP
jgi:hypothetical protein